MENEFFMLVIEKVLQYKMSMHLNEFDVCMGVCKRDEKDV